MKKVITFVHYENECGEIEGFYDEKEQLLVSWSSNDAAWRGEYMDDLLSANDIDISYKPSKALLKKFKKETDCNE